MALAPAGEVAVWRAPHGLEGGEVNESTAVVEERLAFVTDGIESALAQARGEADGKDVALGGGALVARQYLAADFVDEMGISLVPVFLGDGERLFDGLGSGRPQLTQVRTVAAPGVTHLKFARA